MKVIAIANNKGGTAKTTTAVNLAVGLRSMGKKVLVLDLDPQGNLSYYFGINRYEHDMANVFAGDVTLREAIQEREGISVVPAGPDLARVEIWLSRFSGWELVLKSLLSEVKGYDFALIDCPPGNYILVRNALAAADRLLIPLKMEAMHVKGVVHILEETEKVKHGLNPALKLLGAVPVMFEQKRFLGKSLFRKSDLTIHNYLQQTLQLPLLQTRIHRDIAAIEAPANGKSLLQFAPKSRVWQDYQQLTQEVTEMIDRLN